MGPIWSSPWYQNPGVESSPRNQNHNPSVEIGNVEEFQRREIYVVVAGRPRAGKSTALNNIFGLKLEARACARSVTKHVSNVPVIRNNVKLNIVDTPGLGALDIKKEVVLSEIHKLKIPTDTKQFILLYCISVAPSSCLTEADCTIIKNIQTIFGKLVWNRCVLLLTSSDTARQEFPSDEHMVEYIAYLRGHTDQFYRILKDCGAKIPGTMLLFDYERKEYAETISDKLVAVPTKEKCCNTVNILPGILFDRNYDWTDYAFMEILKKADKLERDMLLCFKHNIVSTLRRSAQGGVVGAVIGGGLGAVAGAEAAAGAGILANIEAGLVVGAVGGVGLAGTVLAIGIPASLAWLAIQKLKTKNST